MNNQVELLSDIRQIEIIARGQGVRELHQLNQQYGQGRWRKLKGIATVQLKDGTISEAEVHWYEAHGIGRRRMKIKRLLEE